MPDLQYLIAAIAVGMCLELLLVGRVLRRRRGARAVRALAATMLSGIALVVALWLALRDAGTVPILAALAVALLAHVLDLRARLQ